MPEYAIAGTYTEFMRWRAEKPKERAHVIYLVPERLEGREPGILHRIGTWENSPVLERALELEA